jgi:hypothetical protein
LRFNLRDSSLRDKPLHEVRLGIQNSGSKAETEPEGQVDK